MFPSAFILTNSFIFNKLRNRHEATFFPKFVVEAFRGEGFGCYIVFSGFSTSSGDFARKCFLYTTYVTVGTADAFTTGKPHRKSNHGADI